MFERISGIGKVNLSVDLYDAHYDLSDIDDDAIDWLKDAWRNQAL